jgi:putative transposase
MGYKAIAFEAGNFFHIYHQGNSGESIFRCDENFRYFLDKYAMYIQPLCETYAYALLPNHFHFAVRFKQVEIIESVLRERYIELHPNLTPAEFKTPLELSRGISKQFSDFLNGYTQGFNRWHKRKGRLFGESLKRKKIDSIKYLLKLIHYIHMNPVHHGFCNIMDEWVYSSYRSYLDEKPTRLSREKSLVLFDGLENFNSIHKKQIDKTFLLELEF